MRMTNDVVGANRRLLSIAEAAQSLGVGKRSIWRWISTGRIKAVRLGPRLTRVPIEEVDRLAREGFS